MKKIFALIFTLVILSYFIFSSSPGWMTTQIFEFPIQKNQLSQDQFEFAKKTLTQLIQIKTIRGNEIEAAKYLGEIFKSHNIPFQIITHPEHPDRANIVAELLPQNISEQPQGLILASHLDVVEADVSSWTHDPFSGLIQDDKIIGRGTLDMKGMLVMQLVAFLHAAQQKDQLKKPLMFLAMADEETGGLYGVQYLLKNHAELFKNYKYVINEGGLGTKDFPKPGQKTFNIQFGEKGISQLSAQYKGISAHGSMPSQEYSITAMIGFAQDLKKHYATRIIIPEVRAFFGELANHFSFPENFVLRRIQNPILRAITEESVLQKKQLNAMTSNTIALTGFSTNEGTGYNLIPSQATLKLDIRWLNSHDPNTEIEVIREIAKRREIEIIKHETFPSLSSPIDTKFVDLVKKVSRQNEPEAVLAPLLTPGATDSRYFRAIGFECYGFIPVFLTLEEINGYHGPDEYISIENLNKGSQILTDLTMTWISNL